MDPVTLIGVVSASVTIVSTIGTTIKSLSELRGRYADAEHSIRLITAQLFTIKSALNLIHDWAENDLVILPAQNELVDSLDIAIDGCKEAMNALAEEVSNVLRGTALENTIGFRSRTRYMWNEGSMREHQSRLESQVLALQFLVTAVKSRSPRERIEILHETGNQEIIQKVFDDTSTLRASRNSSAVTSQVAPTVTSNSESRTERRPYSILPSTVDMPLYPRPVHHSRSRSDNWNGPDDERYDSRGRGDSENTSDNLSPETPLPPRVYGMESIYEGSVASEPIIEIYKNDHLGSEHYTASSDPTSRIRSEFPFRQNSQDVRKKTSWLSFRPRKAEKQLYHGGPGSPPPESKRGKRGFEQNFHQSIDFTSSLANFSVPPLVRAAQAGSKVEVEQLLHRGTNIEERHSPSGRNALAVAAHCGNSDIVNLLLQYGAECNQRDTFHSTPLHLATSRGHMAVMKLLLRDGAGIEEKDADGRTPLLLASNNGFHDAVELLLSHKARVNARAQNQLTSLHVAAKRGDAAMIDLLIRHGAHIDAKDSQLMAALHYACEGGHDTAVNLLLSKRADIEARGAASKTPIMCAASEGQLSIIVLLLKRKAVLKTKADSGMNALHLAAQCGHVEVVDFLVVKKMPVNSVNADGNTPLHLAVIKKRFDVVEFLLRRKAELELRCNRSFTALHYGCAMGTPDIVEILLGYGAQLEAATSAEGRPLHIAVSHGTLRTVEILLSKGANHDARDKDEDRALCLACMKGHTEIVKALLNAGAPLRSKFSHKPRSYEDSPLCIAARHGHADICSLLIARGASVLQKDEHLWQPLRYAAYYGHPEVVKLLLSKGAEVTSAGASGGWGFDITASRIGFSNKEEISQERKALIMELLHEAEKQEVKAKTDREAESQRLPDPSLNQHPSELSGSDWSSELASYPPGNPSEASETLNANRLASKLTNILNASRQPQVKSKSSVLPAYPVLSPPNEPVFHELSSEPVDTRSSQLTVEQISRQEQVLIDKEAVRVFHLEERIRQDQEREREERERGVADGLWEAYHSGDDPSRSSTEQRQDQKFTVAHAGNSSHARDVSPMREY